jgi:hypothetical protein
MPKQEGRNMIMVIGPNKRYLEDLAKQEARAAREAAKEAASIDPAAEDAAALEPTAEDAAALEPTAETVAPQQTKGKHMPKMKSHSATAKRFRVTRKGKVLHHKATGTTCSPRRAAAAGAASRAWPRSRPPANRRSSSACWRGDPMARVKRSVHAKKKRRETLAAAKGYTGSRRVRYRLAKEQVHHSGVYAYRDRRDRKAQFRRLWIARINAGVRPARDLVLAVHARVEDRWRGARP